MNWYSVEEYIRRLRLRKAKPALFEAWAAGKGITRYTDCWGEGTDWLHMLKTGRVNYGLSFQRWDKPPYLDHIAVLKNPKTNKCWLTYQPYRDKDTLEATVVPWAQRHGLSAMIYDTPESWYGYGACLVIIEIKGQQ